MNRQPFSFSTIQNFDKHISKSISNYDYLHSLVKNIASFFLQDGCTAYDLGASSGFLVDQLKEAHPSATIIGIEKEPNIIRSENVVCCDLMCFAFQKSAFVSSIFTLQFIKVEHRKEIVKEVFESLNEGGGIHLGRKSFFAKRDSAGDFHVFKL